MNVTVHSAPFAKPSDEGFTATSWLSAASNASVKTHCSLVASARRNAHFLALSFPKNATATALGPTCVPMVAPMVLTGNFPV